MNRKFPRHPDAVFQNPAQKFHDIDKLTITPDTVGQLTTYALGLHTMRGPNEDLIDLFDAVGILWGYLSDRVQEEVFDEKEMEKYEMTEKVDPGGLELHSALDTVESFGNRVVDIFYKG